MIQYGKGEVVKDFPFSFFQQDAGLRIDEIKVIKSHVFKIRAHDQHFILKRYSSLHVVEQQWEFFSCLSKTASIVPFILFPSGDRYVRDGRGDTWILAPYVDGDELSYKRTKDRRDAITALRNMHKEAEGIRVESFLVRDPLYLHWKRRFLLFQDRKYVFEQFGYETLFESISLVSESLYERFLGLDWYKLESEAVARGTWIHGDVAAHNFVRTEHNNVYLIDFDLVSLSPRVYDWIQLGQRFMPYIQQEELEEMAFFLTDEEQEFFRVGVGIPAALVREWNTFLKSKRSSDEIRQYLSILEARWHKQLIFVEQNNLMLT